MTYETSPPIMFRMRSRGMQMQMTMKIPYPMPRESSGSPLKIGATAIERAAESFFRSARMVGLDDYSAVEIEHAGMFSPYQHVDGCQYLSEETLRNLPQSRIAEVIGRSMISAGMVRGSQEQSYPQRTGSYER